MQPSNEELIAALRDAHDMLEWAQNDEELGEIVTHWMPLPQPPKEGS